MNALANAKVNLWPCGCNRRVRMAITRIRGVFQSIDWSDEVGLADAERDEILVTGGHAPEDETNLAWRAADAVRRLAVSPVPIGSTVHKSVPDGAGLGGGSADAAAILILASRRFAVPFEDVRRLAVDLGADVPICPGRWQRDRRRDRRVGPTGTRCHRFRPGDRRARPVTRHVGGLLRLG